MTDSRARSLSLLLRCPTLACVLVTVFVQLPIVVRASEQPLAILVVGDQNAGILTQREKNLGRLLAALRARAHLGKAALPIIAYHFNKDEERVYCEKTLGIRRGNLLFVGVVQHDSRVPRKVIYRINNVVDTGRAADAVMNEVVARLGLDPSVLTETSATTPSPFGNPTQTTRGVTLVKVLTVDFKGEPRSLFRTTDRGAYVNVFLHNDNLLADHRHTLTVACLDSSGRPCGRPMGGPFNVAAGERIDSVDMVQRADTQRHNGILIHENALGRGHYKVTVELDGKAAGETEFEIVADRYSPSRNRCDKTRTWMSSRGRERAGASTAVVLAVVRRGAQTTSAPRSADRRAAVSRLFRDGL